MFNVSQYVSNATLQQGLILRHLGSTSYVQRKISMGSSTSKSCSIQKDLNVTFSGNVIAKAGLTIWFSHFFFLISLNDYLYASKKNLPQENKNESSYSIDFYLFLC